ncbi:MAG: hypothetical protein A3J93_03210 [Candidatus Magasanikbacteria bacterium RIFOXYC2_FULL_42_28]|uniref:TGS domain-containing protein n=1 Tax=Candidatus Magasanikbacteria bacterium RIFOXYC2_FULL_42_28 TaxID=1798704 RepID=A0A1F6NUA7_9BACT|nr:MAG: hypothetical protein A3J93_03210 [Candidatus Magasanikbacteria bacterium RIFOXYC2_FULL_42_28]
MITKNVIVPTGILKIDDLIKILLSYCNKTQIDLVRRAYAFADSAHAGQMRKTGVPYIQHPLAAAHILAQMEIDPQIVAAALLHDVPEDTERTLEDIEKEFGADISNMIRGITKLGKLKYRGVERYIENLRKMFMAMAEDIRVMLIKFADRIHNLSTLDGLPEKKRQRVASESLEIYAPIANRLGIGEFKGLLEDLSFPYLHPKEYREVKEIRDKAITEKNTYLNQTIKITKEKLNESNIKWVDVHGREKQLYSLYQKLQRKNWEVTGIHDVVALRIIVENLADCYAALGVIHHNWSPLKGRIKDYIAQPKPNGYRSLHTTVFTDDGKVVEFQIRTKAMHEESEYGIAAHWHYDEKGARLPAKDLRWAEELARLQKEILTNIKDLEEMKVDFFKNRIFAFTPKGDVIDLPEDATPVDFAYSIHSEVGNKCNGAKVNDQMVSLDTPLRSGDVVEIVTDKNRKGPSPDWLKFVKTHLAKTRIKSSLSTAQGSWLKSFLKPKDIN